MTVIEGRTWLEILQPAECWRLLAGQELGRVAVLVDGAPEIYPVNHIVDSETIVFRTDRAASSEAWRGALRVLRGRRHRAR